MEYLEFIALTDSYRQRITLHDIDQVELGHAYENLLAPVMTCKTATLKCGTGYTATGHISWKRAYFSIFDDDVQIASIAVCLHSTTATPLWCLLYLSEHPPSLPPSNDPWVAIRYDGPESATPQWLARLAWHAAWYLMEERVDD
ncbi:hypothetical protein LH462_01600 [Laribacter hongkongensis]|uniref:Uncharacterized protein n=1 Tax=Laribacter hongkongensis TaxID=168471 RepID=A0ABD4SRS2_9NEIS|nr:hypothetical protein [Laribacter hongkongensis]MCG9026308.1 hypothetical protein [Laribacter hongkongensis]MCG9099346.1 hypothetical protein [Laribacter hongkongensis]MCG9102432.1 hypothetical protein [Laribacter hongkongensis]MCG9111901.1 hypothetical protein [Laribacter hongkongensis]MCG9118948.1 hypothetical protein [Laribacter hongkongensis]